MQRTFPILIVSLACSFALGAQAKTASEVFEQVSRSVVVVRADDSSGKAISQGSGVALPDGDIATNCHVLTAGMQYGIQYQGKYYLAQLHQSDSDKDVCTLTALNLRLPPITLGNSKLLKVGAPVYAVGAPEGFELTLSEGIVSSLRDVGVGSYIQTTAAISPGSSGGGLFDDQGRLLGLTSYYMSEGQQLNFALPVEWIEALQQHVSRQGATKGMREVDLLNQAAAFETRKDWTGLLEVAERWIRANPNSGISWLAYGEASQELGRSADAIKGYSQYLQTNSSNGVAWREYGVELVLAHDFSGAVAAEQQALRINPQDGSAWETLGAAHLGTSEFSQAVEAAKQALRINPQDERAWTVLGSASDFMLNYPDAIAAEQEALRINPDSEIAWSYLGDAYFKSKQYPESISAEQQAGASIKSTRCESMAWFGCRLQICWSRRKCDTDLSET